MKQSKQQYEYLKNASLIVFLTCIRLVFFVYRLTVVMRYT